MGIRFSSIEMPDGTTEKIDATSMSLRLWTSERNGERKEDGNEFPGSDVHRPRRSSYLSGRLGGLSAPLSESAFLRDRIATNSGLREIKN